MATATQLLNVARGEIGYSRWRDPEKGTKYGRWYATFAGAYFGESGVPYCAMFVSWCLAQVGMKPPGGYFSYVPYGINQARAAGRLVAKANAQPGDIVCFDWGPDGVADHTGFVEANHPATGTMTCIEGNTSPDSSGSQSDGGGVWRRTRYYSQICAIIRPAYSATSSAPSKTTATVSTPASILEVVNKMKCTHIYFETGGFTCVADVLAGTWRRLPDGQTYADVKTVLARAGAKAMSWQELGAKSNHVENPDAFGKRIL